MLTTTTTTSRRPSKRTSSRQGILLDDKSLNPGGGRRFETMLRSPTSCCRGSLTWGMVLMIIVLTWITADAFTHVKHPSGFSTIPSTNTPVGIRASSRAASSFPSQFNNIYQSRRASSQLPLTTRNGSDDEIRGNRRRWVVERCTNKCKKFAARSKAIFKKVLVWQKKSRKSVLFAAAVALSTVFSVNDQPMDHFGHSAHQPHQPEIVRVQSSAGSTTALATTARSSTAAADGSAASLQSSTVVGELRGGKKSSAAEEAAQQTGRTIQQAVVDLRDYMQGPKSDTLLLLLATALITPLCQKLGTSPILGFLASGMLLGPNGCGLISGIHTTETLAELGIVFFLFEMGIELSFDRLLSMRKDVFGLGLSQFLTTALAVAGVGGLCGIPANAQVVLGGGLALSSSAFVLQLLKDKDQLATRFGKAAFGVLLFQDLAVVPLLVVTPILAGGGGGLASALGSAMVKAAMALGSIAFLGRVVLNPMFKTVAQAQSQEAFLGVILLTVLSMSFMTEGLGLSNTLGAFLAGVLLSETKYRYQIEADIAPFRGILLGLFFVTVGFEIDVHLIASKFPQVASIVMGIIAIKALITAALSMAFGLSLSTSQQTGLILSQGGEFAFVAFGLARSLGIMDAPTTKLLLTCVSLTMAVTPALSSLGGRIAKRLEEDSDFTHYLGQDRDANEIKESDEFAVVVGYGVVGKVVCDLLDQKLVKYVGLEIDPNKAIQARNKGLPVFYGDIGRPEVAEAFNVGQAKAVIVCIADKEQTNRAVIALRRLYPDLKIFCRAKDADHAQRLQSTLDVAAMVPVLPEDNLLLTLPFAGAVLKSLGAAPEEVNALLEGKRKEVLTGRGLKTSEEEATLMQLGIKAEEPEEDVIDVAVDSEDEGGAGVSTSEEVISPTVAKALEVVETTEKKNPKVAKVIEDALQTKKKSDKQEGEKKSVSSSSSSSEENTEQQDLSSGDDKDVPEDTQDEKKSPFYATSEQSTDAEVIPTQHKDKKLSVNATAEKETQEAKS